MTLSQLHQLPDFKKLYQDERFKAAVANLRSQIPRHKDTSGDWFNGWHDAIDRLMALEIPPDPEKPPTVERGLNYRTEFTPKNIPISAT